MITLKRFKLLLIIIFVFSAGLVFADTTITLIPDRLNHIYGTFYLFNLSNPTQKTTKFRLTTKNYVDIPSSWAGASVKLKKSGATQTSINSVPVNDLISQKGLKVSMDDNNYAITIAVVTPPPPKPRTAYALDYNLGVDYGPKTSSDADELKCLSKHYKMFRLYFLDTDALDFAKNNNMQVVLGTTNGKALSYTDPAIANNYVRSLEKWLKSGTIKVILLGNEPFQNTVFKNPTDIAVAIKNVYSALTTAGYGKVPVSIVIADIGIAQGLDPRLPPVLDVIKNEKGANARLLFVNLYPIFTQGTQAELTAADNMLHNMYFGWVDVIHKSYPSINLNIGETGWASFSSTGNPPYNRNGDTNKWNDPMCTPINENNYINSAAKWANKHNVPTFLFMMYDRCYKGNNWEGNFGLMANTTTGKAGVSIPDCLTNR